MRLLCLAYALLLPLAGLSACARPLGAWFGHDRDGGPPPDGATWPDARPRDGGMPDGAVNDPPVALCDEERDTAPGREITLYGDGEDDWGIVGWRWDVVSKPLGSNATLGQPSQQDTTFLTDQVGEYTVRLAVRDEGGLEDACSTVVHSTVSVPTAICPGDLTIPTRTPTLLHGDAQDDGYIVSWRWTVVSHSTDTDPTLGSPSAQDTTFEALRVGQYVVRLTVTDAHGLTDVCQLVITTTPTPPDALCPADIHTVPLVPIQWTGEAIDDGSIVAVRWEMLSQPSGSAAAGPSPAGALTTGFTPDVVGAYVMRLTVTDDHGNAESCQLTVFATPGEGLRVELYWNPPESPNDHTDIDLHLLHPDAPAWAGGSGSLDCYYANCQVPQVLDWDVPSFQPDNPRLDLDDTSGYGPENINIDEPEVGNAYTVGVHFYSNNGSPSTAQVHVKIYCGTISLNPVYEVGPFALHGSTNASENDFWKVASVTWNGFTCNVSPIGTVVRHWQAEDAR